MSEEGEAATMTRGIILMISGIVIILIDVTILGMVLDHFFSIMGNLMGDSDINPAFVPTIAVSNALAVWFYRLPLLLGILIIVWGFKLIFYRHPYTYPEEVEYGRWQG